jgi:hypothetical protein
MIGWHLARGSRALALAPRPHTDDTLKADQAPDDGVIHRKLGGDALEERLVESV